MHRVAIAHEMGLVRAGLAVLLASSRAMVVVGEASHTEDVILLVTQRHIDVLLLDLTMPGIPSHALIAAVRSVRPTVRIIGICSCRSKPLERGAIEAGVIGVVTPDNGRDELFRLIDKRAGQDSGRGSGEEGRLSVLSPREHDVLEHLALAKSNREIGRALFIVEGTVKRHVASIYKKLGARSRLDVVQRAAKLGLLETRDEAMATR
jgi:DNA-binding NarL/FixJ family response regulator